MPSRFVSILLLSFALLCLLVLATIPAPQRTLSVPTYAVSQADTPQPLGLVLTDTTLSWKVAVAHQQTAKELSALTETLGSGVCAIDVNQDGWVDLFFVGGSGHTRHYGRKSWWHKNGGNRLLLNNHGEYFTDITEQAGLARAQWGMGCAVADFDNNGWPDLIVTGVALNAIYSNTGTLKFLDMTEASGIAAELWSTGASLADFNKDGLVDVYISNYISFNKGARTFERNRGFVGNSVAFDATLYDPLPNKLYLNQGNFQFRDVTQDTGVADGLGRSLGATWTDLNADGWFDLIVINDAGSPNQVYLNTGGKNFIRSVAQYALLETPGSHDIVVDDFDSDGVSDLLVTQGAGAAPIFATLASGQSEKYADRSWQSGIADRRNLSDVSWGAVSADFNNDGHVDVFVANGSARPDIDSPFVSQAQNNQIWLGLGNGNFVDHQSSGHAPYPLSSRSVITADLDNDGSLEIIIVNNNDPLQILENISTDKLHWIGLDLFGMNTFNMVMGARVSVTAGDQTIQRTVRSKQGFLAGSDHRLHIGLGNTVGPCDLTVHWPDGTQSFFEGVASDRYYSVKKAENTIRPLPPTVQRAERLKNIFAEYSDEARVKLGEWLLQTPSLESDRLFSRLWDTSGDSVKMSLLLRSKGHWDTISLDYLRLALENQSEKLQILAVDILKNLELEYSIPWLMPLLADDSADVACATANTLLFFFEQEEAVTHRKYLAVAPLIRLLQSTSQEAAICATNALAAAESKRAVLPLIDQIQMRPNKDSQLAAIRALGLIRDNRAKVTFAHIAGNPEKYPAEVVAQALIALKRMGDGDVEMYLDDLFDRKNIGRGSDKIYAYRIVNELLTNSDGIVFQKQALVERLKTSLSLASLESFPTTNNDDEFAIECLRSIKLGHLAEYQYFAEAFISSDNPELRRFAYETLFSLSKDWQIELTPALLEKESASVLLDVLKATGRTDTPLETRTLENLAARVKSDQVLATELGTILDIVSISSAKKLLTILYSQEQSDDSFHNMLRLCDAHGTTITTALSSLNLKTLPSLKFLYLYCLSSGNNAESSSPSFKLADRLLLKQIVDSPVYSDQEKHKLVVLAATNDSVTAETMLLNALHSYTGQELPDVIEVLSQHQLSEKMSPFLWELLRDSNMPLTIRLEAALALLPLYNDTVAEYVRNELLTDAPI